MLLYDGEIRAAGLQLIPKPSKGARGILLKEE